jgi:oligopeptide/dipeptide ABC transporter ATP-binding protein
MRPLLSVSELKVHFPVRGGLVRAVDDVSLEVGTAETVGLVGESGCGKTTLGKAILRLVKPTAGSIRLAGTEIADMSRALLRPLRRQMQMIFQDPQASLDPRQTVASIIEEPMVVHRIGTRAERRDKVAWLMAKVGMRADAGGRHPHEFSGGQRQRIGIARALALNPKLIVCDEPVSALDVSVRAQVINLLEDLKHEFELSYLFISHDLSVVEHVSDRIAVMYLGRIVETADRNSLWKRPLHPYTQALISAVPIPDPSAASRRVVLQGDLPSPLDPPAGCRFHTRCPYATGLCGQSEPQLRRIDGTHQMACHYLPHERHTN